MILAVFASMPGVAQQLGVADAEGSLAALGPGDGVQLSVYGQTDMSGALTVDENGAISVPLIGLVSVKGLSTAEAARHVEQALHDGQILNDPHVTITLTQVRNQRVTMLGEISRPGRYAIQPDTTLLDLIAQAGGITASGGDTVYRLRQQPDGSVARQEIRLTEVSGDPTGLAAERPLAGDSFVVPKADQFYIYGQVSAPNMYRLESGMTVVQAIARAGGVTARGSERRVEIKRTEADGKVRTFSGKPFDKIQPNDVVRVKESIF
ncbi:MAG: polysaccharide biosynthesis/export family protein [Steroidobacteraceae bacterium]